MAAKIAMKKGLLANLPSTYAEGTLYFTTDEGGIYLDVSDSARIRMGDFQEFATLDALKANVNPSTTALYYITDMNCLAKWNGTEFISVNLDTGATSFEVVGEGNAVTAVAYDEATRKLTLTKGVVFAEQASLEALEEKVDEVSAACEAAKPSVYQVSSDSTDIAVLAEGITGKAGDILIVTATNGVKSAYHYDAVAGWIACDGNVDASRVILNKDITLAGSYTQVGNLTKSSTTTTGTFSVAGKSVEAALTEILSKREQPSITANPSVSITFSQAKAYEVGTSVTPSYSASLSAGSYKYGPATGVTATAWDVSDTNGNEADTASGSFPALVVSDGTNYKITAIATHGAGVVAVDNLGDASNPTVQIAAGTKQKVSNAITGFRSYFYGVLSTSSAEAPLTSDIIRGLSNSNGAYNASKTFTINATATAKRIVVAVPHASITGSRTGLKEVILTSAMNTPVTDSYAHTASAVQVADARGGENGLVAYDVYVYEPASIDAGEVHKITLA